MQNSCRGYLGAHAFCPNALSQSAACRSACANTTVLNPSSAVSYQTLLGPLFEDRLILISRSLSSFSRCSFVICCTVLGRDCCAQERGLVSRYTLSSSFERKPLFLLFPQSIRKTSVPALRCRQSSSPSCSGRRWMVWIFCLRDRKHQPCCLVNDLEMRWRRNSVSATSCCLAFHHHRHHGSNFGCGTVTAVENPAGTWSPACLDLGLHYDSDYL